MHQAGTISPLQFWDTEYPSVFVSHLSYTTPNMQPLLFRSVQDGIYALRKAHMCSIPLRVRPLLPHIPFPPFSFLSLCLKPGTWSPLCLQDHMLLFISITCLCVPVGHLWGGGGLVPEKGQWMSLWSPSAWCHPAYSQNICDHLSQQTFSL